LATAFGYAEILSLSQTGIQAAESAYLEGSACQLQASWFDADRNPYTPLLVNYRIDVLESMTQVLAWTSITPAQVNMIAVTSAQNAMVNLTSESETHQALFQITGQDNNVSYERVTFKIMRAD
jgi:hypothetical protein